MIPPGAAFCARRGSGTGNVMKTVIKEGFRNLAVLAALFALVIAIGYGCKDDGPETEKADHGPVEVGQKAADFTLETLDGSDFTLSEAKGGPVVINFWASWCGPCVYEAPTLQRAYREYKGRGVEFIGVVVQDSRDGAERFIKKHGLTFPNGLDKRGHVMKAYDIFAIPRTYVVDGSGVVSYSHTGPVTEEDLIKAIESAL